MLLISMGLADMLVYEVNAKMKIAKFRYYIAINHDKIAKNNI